MRRRRLLAGLLAAPLPPGLLWAQRFDQMPAPGPARPLPQPRLQELRLSNGLRMVLAQRRGVPLVTVELLLGQAGSLLDPQGKAGLSQLGLLMLSKGARREGQAVDAADIAFVAESLGASLEIGDGSTSGSLGLTLATPQLDDGLALLADLLQRATLPPAEIERARAELIASFRLSLSDPALLAQLLGQRLFWGDSPAGQIATPASLARLRREDLLAFQRQQLRPDSTTLILAGDLDLGQARALAESHFGDWRSLRPAGPALQPLRAQPLPVRTVLLDLSGAGQSAVQLLAPYPGSEDAAAQRTGMLANAVLGQGYSARLSQEVRIKRGLSYGAVSQVETLPGAGTLSAYTQTQHGRAGEVARLMAAELVRLGREPVGETELAARRASLIGAYARQLETTAGLAGLVSEHLQQGRDLATLAQLPQQLAAVRAEPLREFAARYWRADSLRTVVVSDLKEAGADLRQLDPGAWVIPFEQLDLGNPSLRRPAGR
ncbi:pitrilysin family protein [Paucibacter sp. PLA-PC-4]|uniref:M16 family metallopeptidase n=1 Tax=Paucibacter sp. PLA-PC-4 TaxID=2993655 RepID=UPI002249A070|nr:pitrilysin family protein [Paucibacter sp. PLA-PC-4]MCX2860254.1 pitrilysin family protein [Paucibacter sp. PLA-PC-4]